MLKGNLRGEECQRLFFVSAAMRTPVSLMLMHVL